MSETKKTYRLSIIGRERPSPCAYVCKEGYGILFPLLLLSDATDVVNFLNKEDGIFRAALAEKDAEIAKLQEELAKHKTD